MFLKQVLIIATLYLSISISLAQTNTHGGYYQYSFAGSGAYGIASIYPTSDSTLKFYLELNKGGTSMNGGGLLGELELYDANSGEYAAIDDDEICCLHFQFNDDTLRITTANNGFECGFGAGVAADGVFVRKNKTISQTYTESMIGTLRWFELHELTDTTLSNEVVLVVNPSYNTYDQLFESYEGFGDLDYYFNQSINALLRYLNDMGVDVVGTSSRSFNFKCEGTERQLLITDEHPFAVLYYDGANYPTLIEGPQKIEYYEAIFDSLLLGY